MASGVSPIPPGDMMRFQDDLPRLPVPPLAQTLERYLDSVQPHLTPVQLRATKDAIDKFKRAGGDGERLQEKLLTHASGMDNWVVKWWTDVAYMGYRESIVLNSSPAILYPTQNQPHTVNQILQYATKFVMSTLLFDDMVHKRTFPNDYPLDMSQFFRFCGACRVPDTPLDRYVVYPHSETLHMVVTHNSQFFKVPLVHEDGRFLSEPEIMRQLVSVVEASPVELTPNADKCVGILSSDRRDVWAEMYQRLRRDPDNVESIEAIQSAMIMFCLDKPLETHVGEGWETLEPSSDRRHMFDIAHTDRLKFCERVLHGGSTSDNSTNRWYDKTFQICMSADLGAGCLLEHSSLDGASSVLFTEYSLDYVKKNPGPVVACSRTSLQPIKRLKWNLDADVRSAITAAGQRLNADINRLELRSILVETFGKGALKAKKQSTDGFVQVALQLAFRQLHKRNPVTYESVSTRRFKEGRTDTIRSCTVHTDAFVSAVEDPSQTDKERAQLFQAAISNHVKIAKQGASGQAHDRHMLGLLLLAKEEGAKTGAAIPDLFTDPAYGMMQHITLSTSQVVCRYPATILFAPVAPDGYGIGYLTRQDEICLVLSAYKDCDRTDIDGFHAEIESSLNRCYQLLQQFPDPSKM